MTETHLHLGWRTALLGLVAFQLLVLAVMMLAAPQNRPANRWLGLALVTIAGLLVPYAIGFAGAYDAWPWLTFTPFAIPLAVGPFLYAYARSFDPGPSERLVWHALPAVLQTGYLAFCFLLPIGPKWSWYTGGHNTFVAPVFSVLTLVSLAAYALAIGRILARYRKRLANQRSDDDRFSARWLSDVQSAIIVGLLIEIGFWLWSLVSGGIDYFQETGRYLALGALGLYLGVAGWRHASLPAPLPVSEEVGSNLLDHARPAHDWAAIAQDMAQRTRTELWWKEADLTAPRLSRLLGTNSGRLSRAINLGLGMNFSTFINGLRAEGVAEALRTRDVTDLLDLAFEMGFASKASFNRAFRARYAMAPSQFRRQVSDPDFSPPALKLKRARS